VRGNITRELGNFLNGAPCQVFFDNKKVQIEADTILHPDVFVIRDRTDLATDLIFRPPLLVVEVLSPNSPAYDRSAKFALYCRLPALLEHVMVDPDTRRVEAFRRNAAGEWVLHHMSDGPALGLPFIEASVPMSEVFDGLDPPPVDA